MRGPPLGPGGEDITRHDRVAPRGRRTSGTQKRQTSNLKPSAARMSEYACDLEYLFSRMNVYSYGPTKPHLWLLSEIPLCLWVDCRSTSERKRRTHTYDDLVDLLA